MGRKDIAMTPEEAGDFLEAGRTLTVASIGAQGAPHLVPMFYIVQDGNPVFRSFTKSQKIVNLRRDPRVTVLVEKGEAYAELQGVLIEGLARLIDDPDYVLSLYGRLAAKYPVVGDHPVHLDHDQLQEAFGRYAPKNTAVVVEPTKVMSWDHRKLRGAY
jgi:PPOX class probable F420-dependent enzyme